MRRKPQITPVDPKHPEAAVVEKAVEVLRRGGLVAFPTDTLYGLGADIFNLEAVSRVLEVKKRPQDKPIPIFIANMEEVNEVARELPGAAWQLAEHFWPGPLTLVLLAAPAVPEVITAGTGTVGIRIPKCQLVLEILTRLGRPITGTSANRSGGPNPTEIQQVLIQIGKEIDLLLDGGKAPGSVPSTVLDCTQTPFRIIREGPVTRGELRDVLGKKHLI
jgi:L-threonylcarbamoyladenylate synthase